MESAACLLIVWHFLRHARRTTDAAWPRSPPIYAALILGLLPDSQLKTSLQSNTVSQWLGASLESALHICVERPFKGSWWRLDMETLSALLAHFEVKTEDTLTKRPGMGIFYIFVVIGLKKTLEQIAELPVISDAITLMWLHCHVKWQIISNQTILATIHPLLLTM